MRYNNMDVVEQAGRTKHRRCSALHNFPQLALVFPVPFGGQLSF